MKTKEEIRIEFYGEHDARAYDYDELYIMELYAKEYHEQQVNLLNEPAVSKSEGIEREATLIALLGDVQCNIEQYGYLTNDVKARLDKAINVC